MAEAQDDEAAASATQEALAPPPASGLEQVVTPTLANAEPEVQPSQDSTVPGEPFRLPPAEDDETLEKLMALGASIAQATAEINAEAAEASRTSSPTCMSQASKASPSVVLSEVANPLDILDTLLDTVAGEECLKECEEAARRVAAADTASGLVDSKASSSAFGQHGAAAIVSPTVAASPPCCP